MRPQEMLDANNRIIHNNDAIISLKKSCIQEMRESASNSTAHAIPRVVTTDRRWARIFWAVIFIIASFIYGYHVYKLTDQYFQFRINTDVSYKTVKFLFPDITICNLQPFSLRKLELKDPGLKTLQELNPNTNPHFEEELEALFEDTEHDKYHVILECSFDAKPCGPENFTQVYDPYFKTCFTFSTDQEVTMNSPQYGLNLLVYAEHSHPHPGFTTNYSLNEKWDANGIRLVLHEKNTRPYPNLRGINVQPGVGAKISVGMQKFLLYGIYQNEKLRCDDDKRMTEHCVIGSSKRGQEYEEIIEDCYTEVIQKLISEQCGCVSEDYGVPRAFCEDQPITVDDFCDADDDCYKNLKQNITENFLTLVSNQCTVTCEQVVYTTESGTSVWPSILSESIVIEKVRKHHRRLVAAGVDSLLDELYSASSADIISTGILWNNFMRITIYANAMTGDLIEEKLAYPLPNFIGELGGTLGLWLGGSMLTFLEPLELVANFFVVAQIIKKRRLQRGNIQVNGNGNGNGNRIPAPSEEDDVFDQV